MVSMLSLLFSWKKEDKQNKNVQHFSGREYTLKAEQENTKKAGKKDDDREGKEDKKVVERQIDRKKVESVKIQSKVIHIGSTHTSLTWYI